MAEDNNDNSKKDQNEIEKKITEFASEHWQIFMIIPVLTFIMWEDHPFAATSLALAVLVSIFAYATRKVHREQVEDINKNIRTKFKCEFCGAEYEEYQEHCSNCGAYIKIDDSEKMKALKAENDDYALANKAARISTRVIVFIFLIPIIFILISIAIMAVIAIFNNGSGTIQFSL